MRYLIFFHTKSWKISVCVFSSVQLLSLVQLFATPWSAARQASLSITNSQSLLRLMSIKSVIPSRHSHPLSSPLLLPSVFASIRVFSSESFLHIMWPNYWSCRFSISPSNEHSGLISFMINGLISLQSRDTEEFSPTPQFKNINFSVLSFLYSPTLTFINQMLLTVK